MPRTIFLTNKEKAEEENFTKHSKLFKDYYRFIYFILVSFVTGTIFLIAIQYNSSQSMNRLISGNDKLLKELNVNNHLRDVESDIIRAESKIRAAIATDDPSHLEGTDEQIARVNSFLDTLKASSPDSRSRGEIDKLRKLANDKLQIKKQLLTGYQKTGKIDGDSFIANPNARSVSNQINTLIKDIYDKRQDTVIDLSSEIKANEKKARLYGVVLVALILLSSASLAWFVIDRIKRQNQLILQLDVSERKTREAALIKENFMANMSHEIRTPLNSILGFTNLLIRKKLGPQDREFVESIQRAGENLLSIVNDILDLSKIEAGMMRIVSTPFSIRGLIQSIETLFIEKVKSKGLNFKWTIENNIPDTLVGDSTRLTQILVNLIGNALKFTEQGKIGISIFTNGQQEGHIVLGFRITDTGIGISRKKIPDIFDRFKQAEDSTTRNYGGTGLGLSIVWDLVKLQNGNIEVESEFGKGTTFILSIPYEISREQYSILPETHPIEHITFHDRGVKILVVDDNEMNQSLMKNLLAQWGFNFKIAPGGKQAISFLKKQTFDLVLMDIQMPGMDGYSTTGHIRSDLKLQLPIIAMTAHAMAGEREKCLSNGMNEYISKPISERDLLKLICKFVGIHNSVENQAPAVEELCFEYIDLGYMKSISKGNKEYEKTVTGQFIKLIPENLKQIRAAYKRQDFATVNKIAHDMKTSVSIMGLTPLLDSLDAIENSKVTDDELYATLIFVEENCRSALKEAMVLQRTF